MTRKAGRPNSTSDLSGAERALVAVFQQVGFGRLEDARIRCGEVLWGTSPTVVQTVKFGAAESHHGSYVDFDLKKQSADFFDYVRGVDEGTIRHLEIRHGLPFSMEIEYSISRGMPDVKEEHAEAV
jgi:hypothetical protein